MISLALCGLELQMNMFSFLLGESMNIAIFVNLYDLFIHGVTSYLTAIT